MHITITTAITKLIPNVSFAGVCLASPFMCRMPLQIKNIINHRTIGATKTRLINNIPPAVTDIAYSVVLFRDGRAIHVSRMITPIIGMNVRKYHHPLLPISWSLLTETLHNGTRVNM